MTYQVCELVLLDGQWVQRTRDASPSEAADIDTRRAAAAQPVVPTRVTRRQARQALLLTDKLALVQPAIDAIPDAVQRGMAQIEWDDSQDFERNRPTLIAIATAIGLDAAGIDALFIQAASL